MSVFDEKAARLTRLFLSICLGDHESLRALRRAAPDGEPDRAWREAALQTHLFCGFPRLVQAYGVLAAEGGLGTPDPGEYHPEADTAPRGAALFDAIYASAAGKMRARLANFRPDFAAWILNHAYGQVLSRPGLDPALRELLSITILAALDQPAQFMSHARGALHLGATPQDIKSALDLAAECAPNAPIERARVAASKLDEAKR